MTKWDGLTPTTSGSAIQFQPLPGREAVAALNVAPLKELALIAWLSPYGPAVQAPALVGRLALYLLGHTRVREEALRLRRLKAQLIRAGAYEGLAQVLKPLVKWETHEALAQQWHAGEADAVATVERVLASAGLTSR